MAINFQRTLRSLECERRSWLAWSAMGLTVAMLGWSIGARIPVFETTHSARIEVFSDSYAVATTIAGQIKLSNLRLGAIVKAGDILVELDATNTRLQRDEAEARVTAIKDRQAAILKEIQSERTTSASVVTGREQALIESQAKVDRCAAQLQLAKQHAERISKLKTSQAVTQTEVEEAEAAVRGSKASLAEATAALDRQRLERITLESECNTRIIRLERESVEFEGQLRVERAAIDRLSRVIADHRVLSPANGRLDQLGQVREGTVVTAAQPLAVVVPVGRPRVVAQFPVKSVGRIRIGQPARVRLDGFPWTQYGTVSAHVDQVGTEPQSGLVRVELAIDEQSNTTVPLEHGLTGALEIEVERTSPKNLILRSTGQYLGIARHHQR